MVKMEEKKILIVMRAGDHQCIRVQVPNGIWSWNFWVDVMENKNNIDHEDINVEFLMKKKSSAWRKIVATSGRELESIILPVTFVF